jgi:hypothetical protein
LYITKILTLKQDSRFRSGRFSKTVEFQQRYEKGHRNLRAARSLDRLNRDRKTPYVIRQDADKQLCQLPGIWGEKGKFRAFGAAAARANLGMSQGNQTMCYETVQPRPKMGVC